MPFYPSVEEIQKSNDEDDVAAELERKAAEAAKAERLAAAQRATAFEIERKAAEATAAMNMPAIPHFNLTEQQRSSFIERADSDDTHLSDLRRKQCATGVLGLLSCLPNCIRPSPLTQVSLPAILPALHPATVVANAIKSFWDEQNRAAKGDLAALHQFMKAQNVEGVTHILTFNLPEVFNGWAMVTATYLIEHSHVFMEDTLLQDRDFIKKVGRVLVERALLTFIPDGPHARLDYTCHDRATILVTHRTWTADIIDYLFMVSEWPWMSRHVHGWTRDHTSRSETDSFIALQANITIKQGIDLDHVIIPPPRFKPPASPGVRSAKRRRSLSTQTSSSSRSSTSSTSKTSSTTTTSTTTSATSGGTSVGGDDAIRAGCVLPSKYIDIDSS